MAKRHNVPQYTANVMRSFRHISANVAKQQMPSLTETVVSARDAYRGVRQLLIQDRSSLRMNGKFFKTTLFKPVQDILTNAKEDIMSGKLYNEERELSVTSQGMSELLMGMDDGSAPDMSGFNTAIESSSAMGMSKTHTNALARNATANAEYLGELSSNQNMQNMMFSNKTHMESMRALGNLQQIGMSIVNFNTKVIGDHIAKTQRFQDQMLVEIQNITRQLKEQEKRARGTGRSRQPTSVLDNILNASGTLNIKEYGKLIKNNIANQMPFNMGNIKMMGDAMKGSPVSALLELFGDNILPKSFKSNLKNLDSSFGGLTSKFLNTINNWRDGGATNSFQRIIGQYLGFDTPKNFRPNLATYKNKELTVDVEIKKAKAITEVIPSYLNQIMKSLNGKNMAYDYDRGMFVDVEAERQRHIKQMQHQLSDNLGESGENLRLNLDSLRSKIEDERFKEQLLEDLSTYKFFIIQVVAQNKDPSKLSYEQAKNMGLKLLGEKRSYTKLQASYNALSRSQKSLFNRDATNALRYSAIQQDSYAKTLDSTGMSMIFNGMEEGFDRLSNLKANAIPAVGEMIGPNNKATETYTRMIKSAKNKQKLLSEDEQKAAEERANGWTASIKKMMRPLFNTVKDWLPHNKLEDIIGEGTTADRALKLFTGMIDDIANGTPPTSVYGEVSAKMKNEFKKREAKFKDKAKKVKSKASKIGEMIKKNAEDVKSKLSGGDKDSDDEGDPDGDSDSTDTSEKNRLNEKIFESIKKYLPSAAIGGAAGGLIGKLFKKSPFIGAVAGGAINMLYHTSKIQNMLFGDPNKEGDKGLFGDLKDNITSKIIDPFMDIFNNKIANPLSDWVGSKMDKVKTWLGDKFDFKFSNKEDKERKNAEDIMAAVKDVGDKVVEEMKHKQQEEVNESEKVSGVLKEAFNPDPNKKGRFKSVYDSALDGLKNITGKGLSAGKGALLSSMLGMGPIPGAMMGMLFGKKKKKISPQEEKDMKQIDTDVAEMDKPKKHSVLMGGAISSLLGMGPIPGSLLTMILNNRKKKKKSKDNDDKETKELQKGMEEQEKAKKKGPGFFGKRKNEMLGMAASSLLGMGPIPGYLLARIYNKHASKKTKEDKDNEEIQNSLSESGSKGGIFGKIKSFFGGAGSSVKEKADKIKESVKAKIKEREKEKLAREEQAMTKQMTVNAMNGKSEENKVLIKNSLNHADTDEELKARERSVSTVSNMFGGGGAIEEGKPENGETKGVLSKLLGGLFSGGGGGLLSGIGGILSKLAPALLLILGPKILDLVKDNFATQGKENEQGDKMFANFGDHLVNAGERGLVNVGAKVTTKTLGKMTGGKILGKTVAGSAVGAWQAFDSAKYYNAEADAYSDRGDTTSAQELKGLAGLNTAKGVALGVQTVRRVGTKIGTKILDVATNPKATGLMGKICTKITDLISKVAKGKLGKFFTKVCGSKVGTLLGKLPQFMTKITQKIVSKPNIVSKFIGKIATKVGAGSATLGLALIASAVVAFMRGWNNAGRDLGTDPNSKQYLRLRLLNGILYIIDDLLCGLLDIIGIRNWAFEQLSKLLLDEEEEAELKAAQEQQLSNYEKFLKENNLNREGFTFELYNKMTNKSLLGHVKSWFGADDLSKYKAGGSKNKELQDKYGGYTEDNSIVSLDNSVTNNIQVNDGTAAGARGLFNANNTLREIADYLKVLKSSDNKTVWHGGKRSASGGRGIDTDKVRDAAKNMYSISFKNKAKGEQIQNNEVNVYNNRNEMNKKNPSFAEKIKNTAVNVLSSAKNTGKKLWNGIKNIGGKIKSGVKNAVEWGKDKWQDFKGWLGTQKDRFVNWITGGSGARGSDDDYYSQDDPRWGNMSFGRYDGHRDTVADGGCGPAVAAMALQKMTGNKVTPDVMAKLALDTGLKYDDGGTDPAFFDVAGSKYGVSFDQSLGINNNTLSSLKSGKPVVLMGKDRTGTSPFGPGSHYVLAHGLDSNGNVNILDPQNRNNNRKFNIKDIAASTSNVMTPRGNGKIKYHRHFGRGTEVSDMQKKVADLAIASTTDSAYRGKYPKLCLKLCNDIYEKAGVKGFTRKSSAKIACNEKSFNTSNSYPPPIGALLYWNGVNDEYGHVGIYVGNMQVVHQVDGTPILDTVNADGYSCGSYPNCPATGWNWSGADPLGEGTSGYEYTGPVNTDTGGNIIDYIQSLISPGSKYTDMANAISGILGGTVVSANANIGGSTGATVMTEGNKKTITLPSSYVDANGKTVNYTIDKKTYMRYSAITSKSSNQYKLRESATNANALSYNDLGLAMINGRYVVAVKNSMGNVGDYIDVYMDGQSSPLKCIIGDIKAMENKDDYIHHDGSVVEFIVGSSYKNLQQGGYDGIQAHGGQYKGLVTKITNTGESYDFGSGARGNVKLHPSSPFARGGSITPALPNRMKTSISVSNESVGNMIKSAISKKNMAITNTSTPSVSTSQIPTPQKSGVTQASNLTVDALLEALNVIVSLLTNIDKSNETIANKNFSNNITSINSGSQYGIAPGNVNNKQNILNGIISGI